MISDLFYASIQFVLIILWAMGCRGLVHCLVLDLASSEKCYEKGIYFKSLCKLR